MLTYFLSSIILYNFYVYIEEEYTKKEYIDQFTVYQTKIVDSKYRVVNYVKSVILMMITPISLFTLYQFYINNPPTPWFLNINAAIYASTDLSALAYNPHCHISTTIHHLLVQVFYYYCCYNNFNTSQSLCKPIAIYCCFSTMAYLVNYRLSIRFLKIKKYETMINNVSYYIYLNTCILNWIIQLYYLFSDHPISMYERIGYILTLAMIINDDIFLLRFLRKTI